MSYKNKANYINNPLWGTCHKKYESREETIIATYQQHFNQLSIPENSQYWTMAGAHYDHKLNPINGELGQLLNSKLIIQNQFHGVDKEEFIIKHNKLCYPNINWYCGDFLEIMKQYSIENTFNPRIINYDGVMQNKFGAKYLSHIMTFIDYNCPNPLLLIANFVLKSPYKKSQTDTGETIINQLAKIHLFPDHWLSQSTYYQYPGTGKRSRTIMGSFIFIKNQHNTKNFKITPNRNLNLV